MLLIFNFRYYKKNSRIHVIHTISPYLSKWAIEYLANICGETAIYHNNFESTRRLEVAVAAAAERYFWGY